MGGSPSLRSRSEKRRWRFCDRERSHIQFAIHESHGKRGTGSIEQEEDESRVCLESPERDIVPRVEMVGSNRAVSASTSLQELEAVDSRDL